MGFSPGEFKTRDGVELHWELKDGPRIVLWTADESARILDLDYIEASKALNQLETLILLIDGDDK